VTTPSFRPHQHPRAMIEMPLKKDPNEKEEIPREESQKAHTFAWTIACELLAVANRSASLTYRNMMFLIAALAAAAIVVFVGMAYAASEAAAAGGGVDANVGNGSEGIEGVDKEEDDPADRGSEPPCVQICDTQDDSSSIGADIIGGLAKGLSATLMEEIGPTLIEQAADTASELRKIALSSTEEFASAASGQLGKRVADTLADALGLDGSSNEVLPANWKEDLGVALAEELQGDFDELNRRHRLSDEKLAELTEEVAGTVIDEFRTDLDQVEAALDHQTEAIARDTIEIAIGPRADRAKVHIVQPGDHLWGIAERRLGSEQHAQRTTLLWRLIYQLNRRAIGADSDLIFPGLRLRLPERSP
jgi:LysM domain